MADLRHKNAKRFANSLERALRTFSQKMGRIWRADLNAAHQQPAIPGRRPGNPATRRVKQTEYITERIINMSEIEGLIRSAYYNAESLLEEMKKTSPSTVRVEGLAEQIHADLLKAKDFEFCVERRKAMIHD